MPCYEPIKAWYTKPDKVSGVRRIVFALAKAGVDGSPVPLVLPCGDCVGCRLERARQWALRICHEVRQYDHSAFLTLTYEEAKLPPGGSLVKRDLQLFMKRLRKQRGVGLRFFACGEYGGRFQRPHYHVLLLNTGFSDRLFWKMTETGHRLYVSEELGELWRDGHSYVGDVSFGSASYVARYCVKKLSSRVLGDRVPEFITMSKNPGIGYSWFVKYGADAFRHDRAVIDGREVPLTRYYDNKFAEFAFPVDGLKVKRRRSVDRSETTPERLAVRAEVARLNVERFTRDM